MAINRDAVVSTTYHLPVLDTLYRFGVGVDTSDMGLLATVFTEDAVVDFSPCGRKIGLEFPVLTGGETVVGFLGASAQSQVTSHIITNGRVHVTEEKARLQALVDATHILRSDSARRFQMRNWYEVELIEVQDLWVIRRLNIDNIWFTGDPQVLLGK